MTKKLEKFVTPKAVAVYPRLSAPDTKFKANGEFSCKVRMSAEDAAPLIAKIEQVHSDNVAAVKAEKGKGKVKEASYPYKFVTDENDNETGEVEFNIKMNHKITTRDGNVLELFPKLFDASAPPKVIPYGTAIFGGSIVKVAGEFNPFYTATVGAGVSLRLKAVQVIELVQGDDAESLGFGAEEGGYEAPAVQAEAPKADSGDEERTEF